MWFLGGNGNTATWTLHNNIFLAHGSALDFDSDTNPPTLAPKVLFYNNTYYGDQRGSLEGTPSATLMRVDHPDGVLQGSDVQFYNNLTANPVAGDPQNVLISLQNAKSNQVTYADYNTDFGEPTVKYSPPTLYTTGCPKSGCALPYSSSIEVTGGYASHDFSADPQFLDATRNLAAWDWRSAAQAPKTTPQLVCSGSIVTEDRLTGNLRHLP